MNFNTIANIVKNVLLVVLLIAVAYLAYTTYEENKLLEEKLDKATYITTEQAENIDYLQKELDMREDDAKDTVIMIEKAQSNQIPPSTSITVQAPSPQQAAEEITEKIQNDDPTLPEEFTEESDHTIVTEQPENEEYQVGVYKINNYRNWSVGIGVGTFDDDTYIPVAVSRQFSKDQSLDLQVNLDPDKGMEPNGVQIMYNWHF